MLESLEILRNNSSFITEAYNLNAFFGMFFFVIIFDLIFRGMALWRAARLSKVWWFIALLIINSMGILPIIYLLMTQGEYKKRAPNEAL